jgi:hypothetical protein
MLRTLVALLLFANLAFYAWTQGWLDSVIGVPAHGDREPERLTRQVRPETVRVLTPQAVAAAASQAESRRVCLEAGPFDLPAVDAAEAAVATTLPSGIWTKVASQRPGPWIVYMGRYANQDAQRKKADELRRLGITFDPVKDAPELEPGLSLGRHADRAPADAALAQFAKRGVQSAKVVQLPGPTTLHMLRVSQADPDLAAKVAGLKLDALGKGFVPCAKPS